MMQISNSDWDMPEAAFAKRMISAAILGRFFDDPSLAANEIFEDVRRGIIGTKKSVIRALAEEKRDPAELVLTMVWNIAFSKISTGENHIYRGVLSARGKGYLSVAEQALVLKQKRGFLNEESVVELVGDIKSYVDGLG